MVTMRVTTPTQPPSEVRSHLCRPAGASRLTSMPLTVLRPPPKSGEVDPDGPGVGPRRQWQTRTIPRTHVRRLLRRGHRRHLSSHRRRGRHRRRRGAAVGAHTVSLNGRDGQASRSASCGCRRDSHREGLLGVLAAPRSRRGRNLENSTRAVRGALPGHRRIAAIAEWLC
jgi:hypothetical protein